MAYTNHGVKTSKQTENYDFNAVELGELSCNFDICQRINALVIRNISVNNKLHILSQI